MTDKDRAACLKYVRAQPDMDWACVPAAVEHTLDWMEEHVKLQSQVGPAPCIQGSWRKDSE